MRVRYCGGFKSVWTVGLAAATIFSGGIVGATENLILTGSANQATTTKALTPYYSPGLAEVLSLLGAKVSPDVVKTFIKTSSASFDLYPQTIIGLRNMGVSDDIVNALLQREAEIKEKVAKASEESYRYTPPPPPEMPPGYEGQPVNAEYGSASWWWPWWLDGYGFGNGRFDRFDRFGRFNNFNNFRNPNRNVFLTSHQPSGIGGAPPPGIAGTPPGIGGQMPRGAIPAPRGGLTGAARVGGGGGVGGKGGGGVGGAMGGGHR
jgi:hypothetical protein